jgi:hypothetical protein
MEGMCGYMGGGMMKEGEAVWLQVSLASFKV